MTSDGFFDRVIMTEKLHPRVPDWRLTKPCPACGARANTRCFTASGKVLRASPHVARYREPRPVTQPEKSKCRRKEIPC
jgi:hypothetical protein